MKILICPDSFKGSLTAYEAAKCIEETVREELPGVEVSILPLADGGEGTAEIIKNHLHLKEKKVKAHDPLGRIIETTIYTDSKNQHAFIESAEIIGLPLLKPEERNPLMTSSFGLGEVINYAIDSGIKEITVSLGGSATSDAGIGMLTALGENINKKINYTVICDVENPLLGEEGAVYMYAPQKGATPENLPILEKRIKDFTEEAISNGKATRIDLTRAGAGAAGGLGFAFQTFLKAKTLRGIDYIFEITEFDKIARNCDLIITGEGKIDIQSLKGKVVSGVLKKALSLQIPVIVMAGKVEDESALSKVGITGIFKISNPNISDTENMKKEVALSNLKNATRDLCKWLKIK